VSDGAAGAYKNAVSSIGSTTMGTGLLQLLFETPKTSNELVPPIFMDARICSIFAVKCTDFRLFCYNYEMHSYRAGLSASLSFLSFASDMIKDDSLLALVQHG